MPNVLASSLELSASMIGALSKSAKENEESLTGTLLGGLISTSALLSLLTAHLNIAQSQCFWGSYSKYQSKKQAHLTEAGSGSDFALLTLTQAGGARLALFQAKRGTLDGDDWTMDLNRVPQPSKGTKDPRDPQMVVLTKTARQLEGAAHPNGRATPLPRLHPDGNHTQLELHQADLHQFDWVHYLAYTNAGAECIPLRELSRAYLKELRKVRSPTVVSLKGRSTSLKDVVLNGCKERSPHWLDFGDANTAIAMLPLLIPIIPVVVGDGTGTHGPTLENSHGLTPLTLDIPAHGYLSDMVAALNSEPSEPSYPGPRMS